ncbi:MAG: ParA family protein [Ruminococcaceae bacterium]|nr:ParA family protein [Oscillospiraceae bacterium]
MGKCIAVANQKGGVGKTTTSINLSACLGALGKKVLLIDTDPQGNATSGVGVEKTLEQSVYDVLIDGVPTRDAIVHTGFDGLDLLPSSIALAGAEVELVMMDEREYRLKRAIAQIKDDYDFIIIDCPPSLGMLTLNSFVATDTVLIPIQCEYYALEGLSQLTATIKRVKQQLNPSISIEGVLLTMFDARTNLSIQVVEEVKRYYPSKVYASVIPRNVRLSEAPSFGQPIHIYDKHSRGAECYMDLAQEVIDLNEED